MYLIFKECLKRIFKSATSILGLKCRDINRLKRLIPSLVTLSQKEAT